jgi:hypothetical protein
VQLVSRGCWSASAGVRARWTMGVDLLGFLCFFAVGGQFLSMLVCGFLFLFRDLLDFRVVVS